MNIVLDFLFTHTPLLYLTQSLWRDEAFSIWIVKDSIIEVVRRTSGDFNPPLYYILLHIWLRIFGNSVEALRFFSFAAFVGLISTVYFFGKKLFKSNTSVLVLTLLTLINPMLVYFAFELRMYALLTLLSTLSMYFLYTRNWKWYIITTTVGLYTQPFMAFVLIAQGIYVLLTKQIATAIKPFLITGFLYIPWLPTLFTQFKSSGPMWIWPVDLNLIESVIGNMYFGYEGTPPHLWNFMKGISLLFILLTITLLKDKKKRSQNLFFLLWVYVPLIFVVGISLLKPIYVHRYVIFVTMGEIFILARFLDLLGKKYLLLSLAILLFTVYANIYAAPYHRKTDFKTAFAEITNIWKKDDIVLAETPLNYYESLYYSPDPTQVYLFNPQGITPPRYVGSVGMPKNRWESDIPLFPQRAFMIHDDGTYEIITRL